MDDILVSLTAGDWDGIKHRPHHFMKRAAQSGRTVLYVEPPVSLLGPLKNKASIATWKRWRQGLSKKEDNLYVLAPPPILPFGYKYRWINKLNQRLLALSLKNNIKKIGGQPSLYTFLPSAADLLALVPFRAVYYDCVDDHGAFKGLINPKLVAELETELLTKSNVCFATAKQLSDDRASLNPDIHLVPNGAEYEHFAKIQDVDLPVPEDILSIKNPIAGFIGGISEWIDLDLIYQTALQLPEVSFVMIGPVDTDISIFTNLDNVHFLGPKPYSSLPAYIHAFSVCLIPFKLTKLTKSVNPIKMYEYLSAGKPVISTPLPEVLNYDGIIQIANGPAETIRVLMDIVGNLEYHHSEEKVLPRQATGKENSWDARWKVIEQLLKVT
ncbi:glycosyltransferase [Bacillus sp. EB01]|uniref:glycosyltransferase n=1 Tax=Bacillus sp. EB01 TaxID=1347086 RepID=UPI0005C54A8A|nr:glycosyltransferase [Bacillus sp. EB01]